MRTILAVSGMLALGALSSLALAEPSLTGRAVPKPAKRVLLEILTRAGLATAEVTSTTRTAAQQAKVMFRFVNKNGFQAALDLYGPHGDSIIFVCEASYKKHEKCTEPVLEKMIQETRIQLKLLEQQGDERTELMHTSDSHYTIDIAPSSITDRPAFEAAVSAHPGVSRFLKPPRDRNSYHLEIPKN